MGWGPELPPPGPRTLVGTSEGTGYQPVDPQMGSVWRQFWTERTDRRHLPPGCPYTQPSDREQRLAGPKAVHTGNDAEFAGRRRIEFEVHDWMSHGENDVEDPWEIDLDSDDPWPQHPMQIGRTHGDSD